MSLARLNQGELAQLAGIGRTTLNKTLNEATTPDDTTLSQIQITLEQQGIEFLENEGVRKRPEGVDVLNGKEGLIRFLNEIYEHLKAFGGTVSVTGVDEKQWIDVHGIEEATKHFERMEALVKERKDIKIRSITREGFRPASTSTYTEYRWISRDRFATVPFYLCGDKLGIFVFQADPSPKIMLIKSAVIADAYRRQFDELWDGAKEIPSERKTDA